MNANPQACPIFKNKFILRKKHCPYFQMNQICHPLTNISLLTSSQTYYPNYKQILLYILNRIRKGKISYLVFKSVRMISKEWEAFWFLLVVNTVHVTGPLFKVSIPCFLLYWYIESLMSQSKLAKCTVIC